MEKSNLSSNIESELKYNRDEVIELFLKTFKAKKDNINSFLNNEDEIMKVLKQSGMNLNSGEFKQIKKSLFEIRKILREKSEIDYEIRRYVNQLIEKKPYTNFTVFSYILFIILVLSYIYVGKYHNDLRYY